MNHTEVLVSLINVIRPTVKNIFIAPDCSFLNYVYVLSGSFDRGN